MFPASSLRVRHVAHVVGLLFPTFLAAQQIPTFLNNQKKTTPELPTSGVSRFVITGDEIRRRNLRSLDELLRGEVPDVFATGAATDVTTMLRSRGFSSAGIWSIPAIYLNGVTINDPGILREIAPEIVDSVVVRPGVLAGAFEGAGAGGGVIYIYTPRGSDSTRATSSGKITGGRDRSLYDGKSQRFYNDLLAFSGGREGATYYIAGGTASEGAWAPGYRSKISHGIASLSSTGSYGTISGFYLRQRDAGTPDDQASLFSATTADTGFRTDTAQHTIYGGSMDLTLTPFWTLHASGGVHRVEYGTSGRQILQDPFDSAYQHAHEIIRSTSYDARTTFRVPLTPAFTMLFTAGGNQKVGVGKFASEQRLDTTLTAAGPERLDTRLRGYFGVVGLRYNQSFVMNVGARRDDKLGLPDFPDLANPKWHPRADAAVMAPTSFGQLTLRGGVGSVAIPVETYISTAPSVEYPYDMLGVVSVQDLHGAEVGADFANTIGAVGVTLYDQRSASTAAETQSSLGIGPVVNMGGARNKGISAYARAEYHEWSARAAYSAVQSRLDSVPEAVIPSDGVANELPNAFGHASVTYKGQSIRLSYDANYTASHRNIDFLTSNVEERTYPAFFLHDVNASLPFGRDAWILLYAHNIANAKEYDINNGIYVQGRRLGFGVRFGSQ